jgi:hypothetical protein
VDLVGANPIDMFLDAVVAGSIQTCDAWADDVVLDATVPDWRFRKDGVPALKEEYAHWFADPGSFEELRRIPLPDGEVVDYLLTWMEGGVPHAAHHVHVLEVRDGRIARDTVMCGGRWPAALLAEMQAAQQEDDARARIA